MSLEMISVEDVAQRRHTIFSDSVLVRKERAGILILLKST